MRILIVSRFPPDRDGIASYAMQLVLSQRREGHDVEVVSPFPSAAKYSGDFQTMFGLLRILLLSWQFDRTIVQFVSDHFFKSLQGHDFLVHWPAFMMLLAFGRRVDLVIHEAPSRDLVAVRPPKGWVVRAMWRAIVRTPSRAFVHTEWERDQLATALRLNPKHIGLLAHGGNFVRRTTVDRKQARVELGLPLDSFNLLCIGFLQSHKGFDRAVLALRRIQSSRIRLDIVGSMRVPAPEIEAYIHQLRMLVAATPRSHLHEGYLTDELFDRWIVAADVVVLPYRDIWSSGVVERAKLYARDLIVSDVGGLPEQAGIFARVASNDEELVDAIASAAGVHAAPKALDSASASYIRPVLEQVRRRASELRRQDTHGAAQFESPGDTVGQVPPILRLPFVYGASPRALLKRAVASLTRWELRPIVNRVNDLQYRTDARLMRLQREVDELNQVISQIKAGHAVTTTATVDPSHVVRTADPDGQISAMPAGEVAAPALD